MLSILIVNKYSNPKKLFSTQVNSNSNAYSIQYLSRGLHQNSRISQRGDISILDSSSPYFVVQGWKNPETTKREFVTHGSRIRFKPLNSHCLCKCHGQPPKFTHSQPSSHQCRSSEYGSPLVRITIFSWISNHTHPDSNLWIHTGI